MSRARRDLHLKRLTTFLGISNDELFVRMLWAVDTIQSRQAKNVGRILRYPPEAVTTDMTSNLMVQKWEIETLANLLLATPKQTNIRNGRTRTPIYDDFNTVGRLINLLRWAEDAEAGVYLRHTHILTEMHRIGHRTFPWQRGFFNKPQLYRAAYLYGQGEAAAHFEETTGLHPLRFMMVGFFLHAWLAEHDNMPTSFPRMPDFVDMTESEWSSALTRIATNVPDAQRLARQHAELASRTGRSQIAFRPSVLRSRPILTFGISGERMRSPLPILVMERTTAGIYYDLVGGPSSIRNDIAARFETYTKDLIASMQPELDAVGSYKFRKRGKDVDSVDVRVRRNGELIVAIECKTTKLTLGAQFAEDPFVEERARYDEMVKAIMQLWRFFSNVRRGFATQDRVASDATGLVITLDAWFTMSGPLQTSVYEEAERQADLDPDIKPDDRRPVAFTNIMDLEWTLSRVDEDGFISTVRTASESEYRGWMMNGLPKRLAIENAEPKHYDFDPADLLPWFAAIKERPR